MPPRSVVLHKAELFGVAGEEDVPDRLWRRIQRTIWIGCTVALLFLVGLTIWATVSPVTAAVSAPGVVKVEYNHQTIKHLEPGIVRQILVHEGDQVHAGQLLMVFDDAQPKAQVAEMQSAYDELLAERARFEAEAASRPSITFPPELLARRADPDVQEVMTVQQALFTARRQTLVSQIEIGQKRVEEIGHQIAGLKAQIAASDKQLSLNDDELGGVQSLYAGGYAPRTRLLTLQRSAASLVGQKGEQMADVARAQQSIGETRTQTLATKQAQIAEAATGLETSQTKIEDIVPRLAAAKDVLSHTNVTAPVDGTVLNLTQFTVGGVVGPAEALMDIVPSNEPLTIDARIQPRDAHAVRPGLKALLSLTAYNSRTTPRINADVVSVSADQTIDAHTGKPYFSVTLRIPPDQLKRLPADVKIYPGMPVTASIVNGHRTIMSYVLGPMADVLRQSMHEQ